MRMFKVTACVPSQTRIRTQRELQNTYFTKLVPYDNWFREQQRIMKMGGKIIKVELATGKQGANTGLLQLPLVLKVVRSCKEGKTSFFYVLNSMQVCGWSFATDIQVKPFATYSKI